MVARWAHNPKVAGSSPAPAPNKVKALTNCQGLFFGPNKPGNEVTHRLQFSGAILKINLSRIEGFLQELDDHSQRKAVFLLRLLSQSALPFLPDPHGEKVEKDLYALRIMTKTNPRLYYTAHHGIAVMLIGIYKKKDRIPKQTLDHCRQLIRLIQSQGERP
jgi:hypothetical protein